MKARVLVFFGLWLVVAGVIFTAPGCYGRNCEGGTVTYGLDAGQGEMVSDTQWESSPTVGEWLPFPRERTWIFNVDSWGGRTPFFHVAYLSADPQPNVAGSPQSGNDTIGAGNIALYNLVTPNHLELTNDTCSDYYVRLAVELPPTTPTASGTSTTTPPPAGDGGL